MTKIPFHLSPSTDRPESLAEAANVALPEWTNAVPRSYWQQGCDDGKAGKPRREPGQPGIADMENIGYMNGWHFGRQQRLRLRERSAAGVTEDAAVRAWMGGASIEEAKALPSTCPHGTPHRWACDQCDTSGVLGLVGGKHG